MTPAANGCPVAGKEGRYAHYCQPVRLDEQERWAAETSLTYRIDCASDEEQCLRLDELP